MNFFSIKSISTKHELDMSKTGFMNNGSVKTFKKINLQHNALKIKKTFQILLAYYFLIRLKSIFICCHSMNIRQPKYAKNMLQNYHCSICEYECSKKSLWNQHLATRKHTSATQATLKQPKNMLFSEKKYICDICNREYKQRSGLWRHKKTCDESKMVNVVIEKTSNEKKQDYCPLYIKIQLK